MSIQRWARATASDTALERSEKHNRKLRTGLLRIQHMIQSGDNVRASDTAHALSPLAPYNPQLLALRAECALATGAFKHAAEFYDHLLCQIENAEVWAGKGEALLGLKRYRRAALAFQRACALEPNDIAYRIRTAHCFVRAGQPRDAHVLLCNATMPPADNPDLLRERALAFEAMGQFKKAFRDAMAASRLAPPSPVVLDCLFRTARSREDLEQTHELLAQMIQAEQTTAPQWMSLARHPNFKLPEKRKSELQTALQGNLLNDETRAAYNFALFRHAHKVGASRVAFSNLKQYHKHIKPTDTVSCLDALRTDTQIPFLKTVKTASLPASKARIQPIFVCGLPATEHGKISQLIETAANCGPARPLDLVPAVMARLMRTLAREQRSSVTRDDLMGVQSHLRDGLQQAARDSEIVIDTAPLNFLWSGIIATALPEARIVHVKNAPLQTRWGLFSGQLSSPHLQYLHDLSAVSQFQGQAESLMTWWENAHPDAIVSVQFDTLNKARAKHVLEACALKHTSACNKIDLSPPQTWQPYAAALKSEPRHKYALHRIGMTKAQTDRPLRYKTS